MGRVHRLESRRRARTAARGWIAAAFAVWFLSEITRLYAAMVGGPAPLGLIGIVGLSFCAAATFASAAHGRMRRVDEAVLYLDARPCTSVSPEPCSSSDPACWAVRAA